MMKGINEFFIQNEDIDSVANGIQYGMKEQLVAGLAGSFCAAPVKPLE